MGRKLGAGRIDPEAPRYGKYSLNDIREYLGHWQITYRRLKELGWQIPRGHMFSKEDVHHFFTYHYAMVGRDHMRTRKFKKQLPDPGFRPIEKDPDDIMPPMPRDTCPVGFELPSGRSMARPKRACSTTSPPPDTPDDS